MKKIFLNALIISLVIILGTFSIQCFQLPQSYPVPNTSKESSVNLPDNIKTEKARLLQSKYFYKMIECARQLPFQIKEKSFQFIENNENTYLHIELYGGTYNTNKTSMNYRLSSEFFEKYKKVVDVILNSNWEQEVDGLSIEFICYHYQFVVENVNYAREEKYKINSSKEFINKFQLGKITSQELINNSLNFMNEQRVDFVL